VRHWFASPRAAVDFLIRAATLDRAEVGTRCCLTMPGVSATVADQIDALRRVAGEDVTRLIRREPDEKTMQIVAGWPQAFDARRALQLGFRAESDFDEIIRVYIDDELDALPGVGTAP
jgi:nucleoside-diphosphate-sugar epimerase